MTKFPTLYTDDGEEQQLPYKWTICPDCNGHGKSSAYLGAFTAEDMRDDPDFAEEYMAGGYDRHCETCNGSGKVAEVDLRQMTKAQRKAYREQRADEAEVDAIQEAERRAEHYMDCRTAGVNYWEN